MPINAEDPISVALGQYTLEELEEIAVRVLQLADEKRLSWERKRNSRKLRLLNSTDKPKTAPLPIRALRKSINRINIRLS